MNNTIIKKFLGNSGIDDKCINMYLFILEFGDQPISVIAKEIGAKRSSCMDTWISLKN